MNALELLLERQSDSKLTTPGPTSEQLEIIKQAALRAPDHAALKPWQFILVEGDAREKLGEIYYQAALKNNADEKTLERAKELPLRAPLIIICIAKYKPHAKVPRIEQVQSAGCAVMAMQQAAFAQGLAGVWRTGSYAQDEYVKQALKLSTDDELVGFLYLGSKVNDIKKSRNIDANDYFTRL
jgi:nitroreductase